MVQAEDPLFSLDPRPFELALRQAEADRTTTVQNIDASSTSLLADQAEVTQARAMAGPVVLIVMVFAMTWVVERRQADPI